jgi:hypothetical protein
MSTNYFYINVPAPALGEWKCYVISLTVNQTGKKKSDQNLIVCKDYKPLLEADITNRAKDYVAISALSDTHLDELEIRVPSFSRKAKNMFHWLNSTVLLT